jgi:hypothetical protein
MLRKYLSTAASCLVFLVCSYTKADRIPENLKGLISLDICPVVVSVSIDGINDRVQEQKIMDVIRDQDLLFNTKFMQNPLATCSQRVLINLQALRLTPSGYAFSFSMSVYAQNVEVERYIGKVPVKYGSYYDSGQFGYSPSTAVLEKGMIDSSKELFQTFVIDWRKSH